ncbi:MAG: DUF805 domain-containing protein [Robiginitomaculum sp.]|nr:DUF805 domain-containing protein [Robiginitomaculum sp.]
MFSGRASRSEFWYFQLFIFLSSFVAGFVDGAVFGSTHVVVPEGAGFIEGFASGFMQAPLLRLNKIYQLLILLPHIAVCARRLHDINRSGKWQALFLLFSPAIWIIITINGKGALTTVSKYSIIVTMTISFVALILLIIWWVKKGIIGPNKYGDDPLVLEYD